jgi:hypothetical protein
MIYVEMSPDLLVFKEQVLIKDYESKLFFFLSCSRHVVTLHFAKNFYTEVLYFPKISYHTSLYGPIASGSSVDPTSQACSTAMLVSPIAGN